MPQVPTTLVLFTSEFPCGNGEPFLENEFEVLCQKFQKVFVFPSKYGRPVYQNLPANAEILDINDYRCTDSNKKLFFKNLLLVTAIHLRELLRSKKSGTFAKHFREYNSYLLSCIRLSAGIKQAIEKKNIGNAVYYSFWMNNWALALAVLKRKKAIGRFIFRANGFDLYENQTRHNYIPFRPFIFSMADRMFAVSKKGRDHMRRLGVNAKKITYSYFGTKDLGIAKYDPSAKLTLFTCSDLRRIKRADKMVDILSHIEAPVKWVHHGDKGDSEKLFYERIKELRPNVEFELHPRKENYSEVLQFFKNNHFNLFILLSETEGVPVSLIEAMSFGIPLMATDVGGVSEVISEDNGILLPKEFDPKDVAERITGFATSDMNTEAFRKKARLDWEKRFSAANNYETFYKEIVEA